MKKILLLSGLALATVSFVSCTEDRYENHQDYDTISSVIDVTASFTSSNNFSRTFTFNKPIPSTDMILVYKGGINGMWKLLPLVQHIDSAGNWVQYENHFSANEVTIEADFNLPQTDTALIPYLIDQRFRVLIIPANKIQKNQSVDYHNYHDVVKHFNLDDTQVSYLK